MRFLAVLFLIFSSILLTSCSNKTEPSTELGPAEILFASDRDGREKYFSMESDGKNIQPIDLGNLPETALVDRPVWSPQEQKYYFTATIEGNSDIYSIDQNGDNLNNLSDTPEFSEVAIMLSPDGSKIAFLGVEFEPDLFVMSTNGKNVINLTKFAGGNANPTWAPDSQRLYLTSNRSFTPNIYTVDVNGEKIQNLSKGTGLDAMFTLSPDGGKIAFASDRDGAMDIFVMNSDGNAIKNITNTPDIREIEPIWSPDGSTIIFRSNQDVGWDIYSMNPDGTNIKRLTSTPNVDEVNISWSPDSRYLIYNARIDNQDDIFRYDIENGKNENITNNPANDYGPAWVVFVKEE